MSRKGLSIVEYLSTSSYFSLIDTVVIGQDPHVQNDYSEEIIHLLKKLNIKYTLDRTYFDEKVNYNLAVSWRWILPSDNNLIVFHDSLLPKYRGFAPLVNMLINGEEKIGVTALFASEEYDKGPIISQAETKINYPLKIEEAIDKTLPLYQKLLGDILEELSKGNILKSQDQLEEEASYSLWREEEDYQIHWEESAEKIQRLVNAVGFPYKGALTNTKEGTFRIHDVSLVPDQKIENRDSGKIIFLKNGKPTVVCGKGLIQINSMTDANGQEQIPWSKFRTRFK